MRKTDFLQNEFSKIDPLDSKNHVINTSQILYCHHFKKKYGKRMVINCSIGFDEKIHFIVGNNGVGKSTFVALLSGIEKGKGYVYYADKKVKQRNTAITMVMQDVGYQLFTDSVWNELSTVSDDSIHKEKILRELNLYNKRNLHPQVLSGGEKQRLLIGLSMLSNKPIVILDEPTSGLCRTQMECLIKYLRLMEKQGKTIIVITHDFEFIQSCGGNIIEFISTKENDMASI